VFPLYANVISAESFLESLADVWKVFWDTELGASSWQRRLSILCLPVTGACRVSIWAFQTSS
jgi:hypothetical protein